MDKSREIESLRITIRDLSPDDINSRKLQKNTKGVVIVSIKNNSPLINLLSENDIISDKNNVSG